MTLTAIKLPIGEGGALVEYRLSELDQAAGTRLVGHRGRATSCGLCTASLPKNHPRLFNPSGGVLCLDCAVRLGAVEKVEAAR